jgi:hypothetical protein
MLTFCAVLYSSPPWLQHVAPEELPETVLDFLSLGRPLTTLGWLQIGYDDDLFDIPHSVEVCGFMQSEMEPSDIKRILDSVSGTKVTVVAISTDSGVYEKGDLADTFSMLPRTRRLAESSIFSWSLTLAMMSMAVRHGSCAIRSFLHAFVHLSTRTRKSTS